MAPDRCHLGVTLGSCAEAIQLILMTHKTKPSIVLVLRDHLLSNAVFVPMSHAAADNLLSKFIAVEISSGGGDWSSHSRSLTVSQSVPVPTSTGIARRDGTPVNQNHLPRLPRLCRMNCG